MKKTNNLAKKLIVSSFAVAMGAALVGSISGTVAWYQYSTRVTTTFTGASAGTARNLQICATSDGTYGYNLALGNANLSPVSAIAANGAVSKFLDHPVYQYANIGKEALAADYFVTSFYLRSIDEASALESGLNVYLTAYELTATNNQKDITPAVRVAIFDGADIEHATNKYILSAAGGTTTTNGELDLNNNDIIDTNGFAADDSAGSNITYINYDGSNTQESYDSVTFDSIKAGDADPYSFTNKDGHVITTTGSQPVKVNLVIWLEGWQDVTAMDGASDSIWNLSNLTSTSFNLNLRFAVEATQE